MRTLAKQLGFGVMSLYNHVQDKDDLLDAMVDQAAAEIELPAADGDKKDWPRTLRYCAISAYKVMLRYRWLPLLWNRWPGQHKNRYHEAILRIMRQAGVPEELACRGFHAVTMHVYGFALQVVDMPGPRSEELRGLGRNALAELDQTTFPYLTEHIQFHLDGRDQRNDFKYMLDLIIDGLVRDLDTETGQTVDRAPPR